MKGCDRVVGPNDDPFGELLLSLDRHGEVGFASLRGINPLAVLQVPVKTAGPRVGGGIEEGKAGKVIVEGSRGFDWAVNTAVGDSTNDGEAADEHRWKRDIQPTKSIDEGGHESDVHS